MAEKVKVSREVANALKELRDVHGVEGALRMHSDFLKVPESCWGGNWEVFNKYNLTDFARLLIGDFEVEQTPEEELLLEYIKLQKEVEESWHPATKERLNFGLCCIRTTLDIQGVKIEGINK